MCIFSKTTRLLERIIHIDENNKYIEPTEDMGLEELLDFYKENGISIPDNIRFIRKEKTQIAAS